MVINLFSVRNTECYCLVYKFDKEMNKSIKILYKKNKVTNGSTYIKKSKAHLIHIKKIS